MKITIHPYEFTVSEKFAPGETLRPELADYLNQLRANALRELFKSQVKEELLSLEALAELRAKFETLDSKYWLPKLPKPRSPWTIDDEVRLAAREFALSEARVSGKDPEILAKELESHPDVQFLARRRFETKLQITDKSLNELLGL